MFGSSKKRKASKAHDEGQKLMEVDEIEAIRCFEQALEVQPDKSESHYNLGLIYKYRSNWEKSMYHNQEAVRHEPQNEAANWNLAIAATALHNWNVARNTWTRLGMGITQGDGPIEDNFGQTPVRLNPEDQGEVVWAQRLCPVRARIYNIPLPESGFGYGDIVLHDGAATGEREWQGRKYLVFNVLELFERSGFETHVFNVEHASPTQIENLQQSIAEIGAVEDWSHSIQILCRQCSEGLAHESCDQELASEELKAKEGQPPIRKVAVALRDAEETSRVYEWAKTHSLQLTHIEPT